MNDQELLALGVNTNINETEAGGARREKKSSVEQSGGARRRKPRSALRSFFFGRNQRDEDNLDEEIDAVDDSFDHNLDFDANADDDVSVMFSDDVSRITADMNSDPRQGYASHAFITAAMVAFSRQSLSFLSIRDTDTDTCPHRYNNVTVEEVQNVFDGMPESGSPTDSDGDGMLRKLALAKGGSNLHAIQAAESDQYFRVIRDFLAFKRGKRQHQHASDIAYDDRHHGGCLDYGRYVGRYVVPSHCS